MKSTSVSQPPCPTRCATRRCACRATSSKRRRRLRPARVADLGLALGGRTAQAVTFSRDLDRLNVIVDSNALVAARLSSTQNSLGQLSSRRAGLPLQRDQRRFGRFVASSRSPPARRHDAAADLDPQHQRQRRIFVRRHQHRRQADQRLHRRRLPGQGGIRCLASCRISASPRTTLPRPTSPPPRWTISSPPIVEPQFLGSGWQGTWSNATDQRIARRIALNETIQTSVSANETASASSPWRRPRSPACSIQQHQPGAQESLLNRAVSLVGEAMADCSQSESETGIVEKPCQERQRSHEDAGRPVRRTSTIWKASTLLKPPPASRR